MRSKEPSRWSMTDWLYRYRHGAFPWFLMTVLGTLFGVASVEFIVWHFDYATAMMIVQSPIWTIIFAIVASPLAYYVWLVRDRNALESRRQIKEAELMKNFHQLQEWVTAETDEAKRVSALLQLQDFAIGAKYLFPEEMGYFKELQQRVLAFLRFLMQHRQLYDRTFTPRLNERPSSPGDEDFGTSPAAAAMSQIILQSAQYFPDLNRAVLDSMELPGLTIEDAKLNAISAYATNLQRANLERGSIKQARLILTRMQLAQLQQADLDGTILESAELSEANLSDSNISGVSASRISMVNAPLIGARGSRFTFYDCNLQRCGFVAAKFRQGNFIQSQLQKASFRDAQLTDCLFKAAQLQGTDFSGASLKGADFSESDLSGARMDGATFDSRSRFPIGTDTSMMIRV